MALKDYVVTYGSISTPGSLKRPGDTVQLEESEALLMDPDGTCLKLASLVAADKAGDDAKAAALAKSAAAEAAKQNGSKGGGK